LSAAQDEDVAKLAMQHGAGLSLEERP
jgi:hypothetical protein